MSSPLNLTLKRTFVSDGVSEVINLNGNVDRILVNDISNLNVPVNNEFVSATWDIGMANGSAVVKSYTGAQPAMSEALTLVNGIGQVDTSDQNSLGAANTGITAISAAQPALVSLASTAGLANGDVVRLSSTTGMLQIASMDFTISTVIANTSFELSFMDTTGFVAATGGTLRKVNNPPLYSPRQFLITNISQATQAIVTLSVTSDVAVDEELVIDIPSNFGMTEMNGLRGRVVATGAADASGFTNTVTLDIDSSSFTAFAFPLTANFQTSFAQAIRFGNLSSQVLGSTDNIGAFQIQLGSAVVGAANDNIEVLMFSGTSV